MNAKIDVWGTQQSVFLTWNQLRRYISQKIYQILGRDIHPNPSSDNDYWDIMTDEISLEDERKLCAVFAATALEKRRFNADYLRYQKDISAFFVEKIISRDLPFAVEKSLPVEKGVYFFGGRKSYPRDYTDRRTKE